LKTDEIPIIDKDKPLLFSGVRQILMMMNEAASLRPPIMAAVCKLILYDKRLTLDYIMVVLIPNSNNHENKCPTMVWQEQVKEAPKNKRVS